MWLRLRKLKVIAFAVCENPHWVEKSFFKSSLELCHSTKSHAIVPVVDGYAGRRVGLNGCCLCILC